MKETKIPKPKNKRLGISADEFRKEHDPQAKVLSALHSALGMLEKGRFYKDFELRRECGCYGAPALWVALRDDPDNPFAGHTFSIGSDVWWALPQDIADAMASNHKIRLRGKGK